MMGIDEKARDLGNALARTDEYQVLKRAMSPVFRSVVLEM